MRRTALWALLRWPGLAGVMLVMGACSLPPAAPSTTTRCSAPPLGDSVLYLRGDMNQWTADDSSELAWRCNAYTLNVQLAGSQRFKIADEGWTAGRIFGQSASQASTATPPPSATPDQPVRLASGPDTREMALTFAGAQTLRLAFSADGPQLSLLPGHVDDPRQRPITDPVALSVRHDSRALADKSPIGAVTAGSTVAFALHALPGVQQATLVVERRHLVGDQAGLRYDPVARIPMQRSAHTTTDAAPGSERFSAQHRFVDLGIYGYWFELQIKGQTYALQNNTDAIHWTREKGSNGQATVARLPDALRKVRRLRLSVYDPAFQTPGWAADAVYYYIFPERFRNGDKANDPQPGVQRYHDKTVERHPRWLDLPYKPGSGDGSDAVYNNDFFGGDLAGIINKLDDIRDLGANTIYMTPVFRAASNHKYDTADYREIDPGFGSNADFIRLTQEAAKRGIRVVPDTSLNHTGNDSRYFDRFGNYGGNSGAGGNLGAFANGRIQPNSPYASWYRFDATQPNPDKQYQGWIGVADLPELDKTAPAWRDFAYRAPDSITRLWLQRGASGWRMDVAPWVPDDFWREWRSAVKQTNPQAITIAETWFDASKHLLGDMFDTAMNYIFRNAVLDYAAGGPADALVKNLELVRELYPPPAFNAMMNLLSSHDAARALHRFGYLDDKTGPAAITQAKQRLKLALLFQVSYPGAPTVYYGDEVGLTGGEDPYNRAPYPWADEGGQPDLALRADFKRLIALRSQYPVLRRGVLQAPLLVDGPVLVLARRLAGSATGNAAAAAAAGTDSWAITATNSSGQPRQVTLDLPAGLPDGPLTDTLSGTTLQPVNGKLTLVIPAMFGVVLLPR